MFENSEQIVSSCQVPGRSNPSRSGSGVRNRRVKPETLRAGKKTLVSKLPGLIIGVTDSLFVGGGEVNAVEKSEPEEDGPPVADSEEVSEDVGVGVVDPEKADAVVAVSDGFNEVIPEGVDPEDVDPDEVGPVSISFWVVQEVVDPVLETGLEVIPDKVTPEEVTSIEFDPEADTPEVVDPDEVDSEEEVNSEDVIIEEDDPEEDDSGWVTSKEDDPEVDDVGEDDSEEVKTEEVVPVGFTPEEVTPDDPVDVDTEEVN